jgi:hypothetical protein
MAFASFWLFIGELITLHQERIYKVHYYDHSNPFTKPKSKDDGKTLSFKLFNSVDKAQSSSDLCCNFSYRLDKLILNESQFTHKFPAKQAHSFLRIVRKPLRAPPAIS